MDFKAATTRIRRTFAYPSDTTTTSPSSSRHASGNDDDDDDYDGPALDEQEQEELIRSLVQQNAARNAQFRLFLLALPALSAVPYLLVLAGALSGLITDIGNGRGEKRRGVAADVWVAFLALSSLAATTWSLWSLPPGVTGIRILDSWSGSAADDSASTSDGQHHHHHHRRDSGGGSGGGGLLLGANARRRRASTGMSSSSSPSPFPLHHRSPLQRYLPLLNLALCALLVLAGLLSPRRSAAARHWGHVGLANLPALIYAVVLLAKTLMGSIDPERELNALRYEYKGA